LLSKGFETTSNDFMHCIDFGKGQRAAHQPSQRLVQRVVEPFDMVGLLAARWHDVGL